jgi:alpha-beta hydrolase superfamily lysophospholipase
MAINAASESNSIGPARRVIVLVHGSWCYAPIVPLLAAKGITAEAFDLRGYGLTAKLRRVTAQERSMRRNSQASSRRLTG